MPITGVIPAWVRCRACGSSRASASKKTTDAGLGALVEPSPVFLRNADGSFTPNAAGARIRRPEAGAAGSLQELRLTTRERAARTDRTYHGYYPSLHLTFDATEQFLIWFAYAKTFGRPNLISIVPSSVITQFDDVDGDPSAIGGTITVQNSALRPCSEFTCAIRVD